MTWNILLDEEFAAWLDGLVSNERTEILAHAERLRRFGPALGRPSVDQIKGSAFRNMKELRLQIAGKPWRILFAFDPKRSAVLLVGGNKAGDKRWYEKHVPIADQRFQRHLDGLDA